MASKNYLDGGGLAHLWDKIKSYLTTWIADWKTTNFGNGTYENYGSIFVALDADMKVAPTDGIVLVNFVPHPSVYLDRPHGFRVVILRNGLATGITIYLENKSGEDLGPITIIGFTQSEGFKSYRLSGLADGGNSSTEFIGEYAPLVIIW